ATSIHQQFPDARYNVKRAISEGDLVLLHSNVVLVPGTKGAAVIDIFRFQGGRIAEHWDVIQNVPDTTASGNDMFSTLSSPRVSQPLDHRLTQANQALVTKAFDELMVHKDLTALDRYWDPGYLQHNPQMQSGVPAAKAGLGGYFASVPQLTVTPKRIIAEGDLVAVHSHYVNYPGDRGAAILDLFRVRNGKIVEHWDIIQSVPETSANGNGMF
ncbi:nuclear transport factor 2 family protein, partial [Streptomyces ossamyceticus]